MFARLGTIPLRRRTYRRGDVGEGVRSLQEQLHAHGYEVGSIDGVYGYITEDAVMNFQRDHRLRVDGVAGPQVMFALTQRIVPQRVYHRVRRGERWTDIARTYGVSVNALRWMNGASHRGALRQGRRLVIRQTYVLLGADEQTNPHLVSRTLLNKRGLISGFASPRYVCHADGSIEPKEEDAFAGMVESAGWDHLVTVRSEDESLATILLTRRRRRRFISQLGSVEQFQPRRGLLIDFGEIPFGAGARIGAAARAIRERLPQTKIVFALPPPLSGWRAFASGLDLGELSECADRVILSSHRWTYLLDREGRPTGHDQVEQWVARATKAIVPWKLWLGIPLGGCRYHPGSHLEHVPYRLAVADGFRHRQRPAVDDSGFLRLAHPDPKEGWHYTIQGRGSFERFLRIALRFSLGGVYLHPIGGEDNRLWDVLGDRVKAAKSSLLEEM